MHIRNFISLPLPLPVPLPLRLGAGGLAMVLAAVAPAAAQCRYTAVTFRGPELPGWGVPPTVATAINDLDQVAGYYEYGGPALPFVWSEATGMVDLPRVSGGVRPTDINDAGWIVGYMGEPRHAFVWDGEQYIDLGIPPGGTFSEALAINNDGVVVGYWGNNVTGDPAWEGFIWRDGVMTLMGSVLDQPESRANDISDSGLIAGVKGTLNYADFQGFVYQESQSPLTLPPAPGCVTSELLAINNTGDGCGTGVTGHPSDPEYRKCGFAWIGGTMQEIRPLPGYRDVRPRDINDHGVVVGYCSEIGTQPFVWRDGHTSDLEDLTDHSPPIYQMVPNGINSAGNVVGSSNRGGVFLTPFTGGADLTGDGFVDLVDLLILLQHFGCTGECAGDVTADGTVDLSDLALLLSHWCA